MPNIIYHYCDCDAFFKIIQSKYIFLSNHFHTNDKLENRWLDGYCYDELNNLKLKDSDLKNSILEYYNYGRLTSYIACFSSEGDVLSQWRGYADDGYGVAIGFNPKYFNFKQQIGWESHTPGENIGIHQMLYDKRSQEAFVRAIIAEHLNNFRLDGNGLIGEEVIQCVNKLRQLVLTTKNPGFEEEKEWRISHVPLISMTDHGDYFVENTIDDAMIKFRTSVV